MSETASQPRVKAASTDCKACRGVTDMLSAFARGGFSKPKMNPEEDGIVSRDTSSLSVSVKDQTTSGRATWTFLHTTAAYYPDSPSTHQQSLMRSMMEGLAEFYPCHHCAAHFREQIKESPPQVDSAMALSQWLCRMHNEVNDLLGKPLFDCSRVMERWKDGPADGTCD
ncbi:hypothetical protein CEUSTIGMA_g10390.t1 [Chlamydomonas eustigma]|uniref:Sulfhydryl oxidase n=1 Tax=Chlamydomonas eustigma TaxID=1157962 RepID=A0A250XIU6_9CHLO|nr:hypothetical protein CEUSTIGMA_g10390.t1 [Chlamydomonas eustigma]|eukprot:GAX82963.1 hypothetical protein CEUSTIGMA_g10390.t1 [Chlamydomonas eustigma]